MVMVNLGSTDDSRYTGYREITDRDVLDLQCIHGEIQKCQYFLVEKNKALPGAKRIFLFLIWVLRPFQEHFTYIKLIVHQRWVKTGEPGEKPPDHQ